MALFEPCFYFITTPTNSLNIWIYIWCGNINLIPVFAVILSWLLLGETFGWSEVLGGAIILTGVWIAQSEKMVHSPEMAADPDAPKGV